jgi:adenylate cyclase class 2
MEPSTVEIEAKFYLHELDAFRTHLKSLGAELVSERILERNWRFDTPDQRLTTKGEVLRIREDRLNHLTYKRPIHGSLERVEFDIEVEDSTKCRMLLEALGFEVFFLYEKYRETYELDEAEIVLDEMPYGSFIEIEGSSVESIRKIAEKLGLSWNLRVVSTYHGLFEFLCEKLQLPFRDATFEAFSTLKDLSSEDLDHQDAFYKEPPGE